MVGNREGEEVGRREGVEGSPYGHWEWFKKVSRNSLRFGALVGVLICVIVFLIFRKAYDESSICSVHKEAVDSTEVVVDAFDMSRDIKVDFYLLEDYSGSPNRRLYNAVRDILQESFFRQINFFRSAAGFPRDLLEFSYAGFSNVPIPNGSISVPYADTESYFDYLRDYDFAVDEKGRERFPSLRGIDYGETDFEALFGALERSFRGGSGESIRRSIVFIVTDGIHDPAGKLGEQQCFGESDEWISPGIVERFRKMTSTHDEREEIHVVMLIVGGGRGCGGLALRKWSNALGEYGLVTYEGTDFSVPSFVSKVEMILQEVLYTQKFRVIPKVGGGGDDEEAIGRREELDLSGTFLADYTFGYSEREEGTLSSDSQIEIRRGYLVDYDNPETRIAGLYVRDNDTEDGAGLGGVNLDVSAVGKSAKLRFQVEGLDLKKIDPRACYKVNLDFGEFGETVLGADLPLHRGGRAYFWTWFDGEVQKIFWAILFVASLYGVAMFILPVCCDWRRDRPRAERYYRTGKWLGIVIFRAAGICVGALGLAWLLFTPNRTVPGLCVILVAILAWLKTADLHQAGGEREGRGAGFTLTDVISFIVTVLLIPLLGALRH